MKFLQYIFLFFAFAYLTPVNAQPSDLSQQLWDSYNDFKEPTISHRKFKHQDILPLIGKLEMNQDFEVN